MQIRHPRLKSPLLYYNSVDRRLSHRIAWHCTALHCKTRSRPIVSTVWGSTCVLDQPGWARYGAVLCCTVGGSGIFGFGAHPIWTSLQYQIHRVVQQDSGYIVSEPLELISSQAAVAHYRIASSIIIINIIVFLCSHHINLFAIESATQKVARRAQACLPACSSGTSELPKRGTLLIIASCPVQCSPVHLSQSTSASKPHGCSPTTHHPPTIRRIKSPSSTRFFVSSITT